MHKFRLAQSLDSLHRLLFSSGIHLCVGKTVQPLESKRKKEVVSLLHESPNLNFREEKAFDRHSFRRREIV